MLPLHEKAVMLENLLPEDPEDGVIVEAPKGQTLGGSTVISVYMKNKPIGSIASLIPIVNVSRKYTANRLSSNIPIKKGDIIRITGRQYSFDTVIFVQYFGWIGYKASKEPVVASDKFYRVLAAIPVGPEEPDCLLYEKVCLEALEKKDE